MVMPFEYDVFYAITNLPGLGPMNSINTGTISLVKTAMLERINPRWPTRW